VRLTAQVDAMLRDMAAPGCSRRTIGGVRSLLVRAIRRAERDNIVTRNVAAVSEMPAAPERTSKAMTLEQVGALLALDLTPWWRAFITTGVMLGLRPGELLGLRWEDIDAGVDLLRVRQALHRGGAGRDGLTLGELKTPQSRRTLRMPAPVRSALAALRREQAADRRRLGEFYATSGLVFADNAGRPAWPQAVGHTFKNLCEEAGLGRDWQLRELRHTFVSQMSQAGVDLETIADHVGRVNSNVTRVVYRHQLADQIGTAAEVFDKLYGASS
jgi:integrase